jgi:hypothetical protein
MNLSSLLETGIGIAIFPGIFKEKGALGVIK